MKARTHGTRATPHPRAWLVGLAALLAVQVWSGAAASERSSAATGAADVLAASGLFALSDDELAGARAPRESDAGAAVASWRTEDRAPMLYLAALQERTDAAATAAQERHWSGLPFLGELATQAGYELPLPFGVTAAYNYVARDIEVTDVRIGVDGAPLSSVSQVANFKARSVVDAGVAKLDAWLLPFLDLYLLGGYIRNVSDVNIRVTIARPGPLPGTREFQIKTRTDLEGFVGGGGMSLAGGWRQLFAMVDVNYTKTDLGFDDRFRALIASGRVGWNGKVGAVPLRLWAGAAYWDTKNTAKATVDIPDVGRVRFEADQGPKHPWNAVVGVSSAVRRHLELFAEYGFNAADVTFFAGGLTVRF